jgi:hypothetical protein
MAVEYYRERSLMPVTHTVTNDGVRNTYQKLGFEIGCGKHRPKYHGSGRDFFWRASGAFQEPVWI